VPLLLSTRSSNRAQMSEAAATIIERRIDSIVTTRTFME
jgi:hypothetical protein